MPTCRLGNRSMNFPVKKIKQDSNQLATWLLFKINKYRYNVQGDMKHFINPE